nr:transcriptional protein SWT1-like isoform X2 [Procambarus clarkii]
MAATSGKNNLPEHWVQKTSSRCPTATYYFNTKTGKSSWMHPSLLKESSENCSEESEKQKSSPPVKTKKVKMKIPKPKEGLINGPKEINGKTVSILDIINTQLVTPLKVNPVPENSTDIKSHDDKTVEEQNWKNRKPVKFVIKAQTEGKFSNGLKEDSPKVCKKPVPVHSSLLRARKIAENVKWLKKTVTSKESEKMPQAVKSEEKTVISDDTCKESKKQVDKKKELITSTEKRNIFKAKRRTRTGTKNAKEDEAIIRDIIKEISSNPIRDDGECKSSKKSKKVSDNKNIIKEHDVYRHFIKCEEESHPSVKSLHKTDDLSKKTRPKLSSLDMIAGLYNRKRVCEFNTENDNDEVSAIKDSSKSTTKLLTPNMSVKKKTVCLYDAENEYDEITTRKDSAKKTELSSPSLPVYKRKTVVTCKTGNIPDEVIAMEVEEQEIITEIANFRGSVCHTQKTESIQLLTSSINSSSKSVHIVVDTNVLIQDIGFLESLKTKEIAGKEVVIVVPYTALQEMDGLKKKESIGKACQEAIRWCNSHFQNRDPRVQGQSYDSYLKTLNDSKRPSGDDLIRDCCLTLKKEGLDVCLLTNDVNLQNKSLMSDISAIGIRGLRLKLQQSSREMTNQDNFEVHSKIEDSQMKVPYASKFHVDIVHNSTEEPFEYSQPEQMICDVSPVQNRKSTPRKDSECKTVRKARTSNNKCNSEDEELLHKISTSLNATLSQILELIMKDTYGDIWTEIVIHKPPWNVNEVLSCWEKHWIAVMSDKFPRRIKELLMWIKRILENYGRGSCNANALREQVQNLYDFFKDGKFKDYIFPIHGQSFQTTNITEISDQSSTSSTTDISTEANTFKSPIRNSEDSIKQHVPASSGTENIEKMINLVGMHITHFIAMILDAYGVTHSLPTLNTANTMTREGAQSSCINLHNVTMRLGL